MNLIVKTLSHQQVPVEIPDATNTILSFKKLLIEKNIVDLSTQDTSLITIIYQGKVLKDESTIESNGLVDNDFVVLLVSKNKSKQTVAPVAVPKSGTTSNSDDSKSAATPSTNKAQTGENKATSNADLDAPKRDRNLYSQGGNGPSPAAFAGTEEELEMIYLNLMALGDFDRATVKSAFALSKFDPNLAAEILCSRKPSEIMSGIYANPTDITSRNLPANSPLAFLKDDPQFQQLRAVILQNPAMAQPILQQIGAANPRLLQLINENQQYFLALLEEGFNDIDLDTLPEDHLPEDVEHDDEALLDDAYLSHEHDDEEATNDGAEVSRSGAPRTQIIQVSSQEKEAIDRLVDLGFERSRVIEAYFACDRNETLAANFLFDHLQEE